VDLVVDASVAFKWFVTEADSEAAYHLLRENDVIAPDVLLVECRNAALTRTRRGQLTVAEARRVERDLYALQLRTLPSTPFLTPAFEIALELGHPIYDCVYLAVAHETRRTLVTADERFTVKALASPLGRDCVTLLADLAFGR
jgi:predicted nucleic acid-binding protein